MAHLVGCLKEIGKCILTQCIQPPVKRHFDYWWCFHNNIEGLGNEVGHLDQQIHDLKQKIEEARLRLKVVRPGVQEWLNLASEKLAEGRRILQEDDNIPKAWNIASRYSMGKRAKKTAQEIAKVQNDGTFNTIADPPLPPAMRSPYHRLNMEFESRKSIEKDIVDCLKKSTVGMIVICGMGGVGKTTMAQRIWKRVKEQNIFDEVVMVTVSQTINMAKIQNEIAELLGLQFDEESIPARAHRLRRRLMDAKRKIIIFDDVWKSLNFEDLGIPIESNFKRCKVLLTSRSRETSKRIKNKVVFDLKILEQEEAWILFKEKAGKCAEDSNLHSVAKDVAKECKGLPIALVTVGLALRHETNIYKWKESLSQLRGSNPIDFPEVLRNVYKPLKLSYDSLYNDSERYLFLMCSLFPEDYNITIDQLTWYSMGLGLFNDIKIEKVRDETHVLVEKLERHHLLIWNGLFVKMHDVVRDVAIYIGSIENHGFLKSLHRFSIENSSDVNCNWMSVDISNAQMEVPVLSRFPKLRLLMLSSNVFYDISDISFEGMEDLNVLSFESISIRSLPTTLGSLENLQTFCLFGCEVQNISVIGKLTSLKIFSCFRCENIMELPEEIVSLSGLRLLELNRCHKLQRIPFGVISSLVGLVELKIRRSFRRWEAGENGKQRRNASLTELECLPNLTGLEIEIDDCTLSAQEICLSLNLVKYYICIGSDDYYSKERDYEKVMILNLPGAVGKWIRLLARNAEWLYLKGDGSASNNFNIPESENLRNLSVWNCSTLKKLVETKDCKFGIVFPLLETLRLGQLKNLEEICNQDVSFCNLKSIDISQCYNLRSLFLVSVARRCLLQLEVLKIQNCATMEQVFWNEIRDDTDGCIEFPKLKQLSLVDLPNLTAFCQGLENIIIKFPNLTQMHIEGLPKLNSLCPLNSETLVCHDQNTCFHFVCKCNPKVEMGPLKDLTLFRFEDNIRNIWCCQIPNNIFNNLGKLEIAFMNGIRSLMSTSIAKNLESLKYLHIIDCGEMVEVIKRDDDDKQLVDINCLFPTLKLLYLEYLHKLKRFWQWNYALKLPLLEEVSIYN